MTVSILEIAINKHIGECFGITSEGLSAHLVHTLLAFKTA